MDWTPDAEERLRDVPFLVRPVVRLRIESLAREAGHARVDTEFFDQARARFGRK